jgi:pyruvate formate lyase activating enzyme
MIYLQQQRVHKGDKSFMLQSIFGGIQRCTTVDDPGYVGMTLFTNGCNFRCKYCHNPNLVLKKDFEELDVQKIVDFLNKRKGLVQSVIICGGEPSLHKNLIEWLRYIKELGYRIKLDTNATNPILLKQVMDEKLVDYFAIDYKAPKDKYEKITQTKLGGNLVFDNIKFLIDNGADLEIRTTVHTKLLSKEDIEKMIQELSSIGVKKYFLQGYIHLGETVGDVEDDPLSRRFIQEFEGILKENFEESGVRNLD